jgi:Protein of unknown function (DUF2782)
MNILIRTLILALAAGALQADEPSTERGAAKVSKKESTRAPDADAPLPDKAQAPDEPAPTVTIRNVKGAVIEEYRNGSRLYMIRVVPERGIAYTYLDTDGDGRLEHDGKDGPVRPVYYTLYEWD